MEIDRRSFVAAAAVGCSLMAAPSNVVAQTDSGRLNHRSTDGGGPVSPVEAAWTTSEEVVGHADVVDGLHLSVTTGGELVARDAGDATEVWRHDGGGGSSAGVQAHDGLAVYTSGNTTYGVDLSTGEEQWSMRDRSTSASTPTVTSRSIIVGRANSVYDLGSNSGGARWSYETGGPVRAKPAFDGGYTYFGSDDGKLYRVDDEGIRDWQHDMGGDVRAAPVIHGDVVHVANTRGDYHGVDVSTGEEEWSRRLNTRVDRDPALGAGHLYLPTDEGVLIGFDSETGVDQWRFEAEGSPAYSPWVTGEAVHFVAGSTLYALDPEEGEELWSLDVSGGGSTVVADSAVYTGGSSGRTKLVGSGSEDDESADLVLADASIEDQQIEVGGATEALATVENDGGETGEMELVVYVEDEERETADVEVAAGGSEEHSFTLSFDEPGSFDVRVNDVEAGTVEVTEPEASEEDQGTPSGIEVPLSGFGFGAAAASLAAGYLYGRKGGSDGDAGRR